LLTTDESRRIFESALERVGRSFQASGLRGDVVMLEHAHLLLNEPEWHTSSGRTAPPKPKDGLYEPRVGGLANQCSVQEVHGETAEAQILVSSDWVANISVCGVALFVSESIYRHAKELHAILEIIVDMWGHERRHLRS
jgi:hypothetical protein